MQDLQPLEAGGTIPLPLTISSRRTNLIGCFIADFGVPSIGIFDATLRRVSHRGGDVLGPGRFAAATTVADRSALARLTHLSYVQESDEIVVPVAPA